MPFAHTRIFLGFLLLLAVLPFVGRAHVGVEAAAAAPSSTPKASSHAAKSSRRAPGRRSRRGGKKSTHGNGNGHGNGHGNGGGNGQGNNGNGNGNGGPNGNGNGNGGGNGQGNNGNGNGNGGPNGNGNGNGNGNAYAYGNGEGNGQSNPHAGGNGKGHGTWAGTSRPELSSVDEELGNLEARAVELQEAHTRAVEAGRKTEAEYALRAGEATAKVYFETRAWRDAVVEYLDAKDAYEAAAATGDSVKTAAAYDRTVAAYTRAIQAVPQQAADQLPPATQPELGSTVNVTSEAGVVMVRVPGASGFVPLVAGATIPTGSVVDARYGKVKLTTAVGDGTETQSAVFHGSQFKVKQPAGGRGRTELVLRGGDFSSCSKNARGAAVMSRARRGAKRRLWGNGKGLFTTRGRDSVAIVRGTHWLTQDTCKGTLVAVRRGVVEVRDLHKDRTVTVHAGERYLARHK